MMIFILWLWWEAWCLQRDWGIGWGSCCAIWTPRWEALGLEACFHRRGSCSGASVDPVPGERGFMEGCERDQPVKSSNPRRKKKAFETCGLILNFLRSTLHNGSKPTSWLSWGPSPLNCFVQASWFLEHTYSSPIYSLSGTLICPGVCLLLGWKVGLWLPRAWCSPGLHWRASYRGAPYCLCRTHPHPHHIHQKRVKYLEALK